MPIPPDGDSRMKVGRRGVLAFLVAAPTLTVAVRLGMGAEAAPTPASIPSLPDVSDFADLGDLLTAAALPTSRLLTLQITTANRVVLELPRAEVGQGISTAVAMIVADELDARLSDVDTPLSDARRALVWNQLTGGSNSVRSLYGPVRALAAEARARLVTAAAQRWDLPADRLVTRDTRVVAPDGRTATYGSLSAAAAKVTAPAVSARPKPESQHRVIGRPTRRVDARALVTGSAEFALDVAVPGAMAAVVARPPTIGGTVASVDDSAAKGMPGVVAVARIPTGVAVVAETFGQAIAARDALKISWGPGPVSELSDVDIRRQLRAAVPPFGPLSLLTPRIDAEFDFAFVPHAPMETNCAVADVRADRAEIWASSKTPIYAQQTIAAELGLPQDRVTMHVTRGGGSFGRKLFFDAALEAAQVSRKVGRPIRLMWTRADDVRHGRMRPATHHRLRVTHAAGQVLSYEHRVASVQTDFRTGIGEALSAMFADLVPPAYPQLVFRLTEKVPYNFGLVTELLNEIPLKLNTASWRSVYSATVRAAEEIMVDEVARKLGRDPVAFRRATLQTARGRAVLDAVASRGKWGRPMPAGHAQGVAYHEEYKSCTACLVEIDATDPRRPRVTRATIVADVGRPINPKGLEAQLLGGLTDGISTILQAGAHIDHGLPLESSFSDFRYARQRHTPSDVDIHIMPATGEPGGAGELGVPAAAGAVANAYARATGTSPRSFPINFDVDFTPLPR
ncbi:MAG TPA: molybdopterin cofactor-binding domain-containing protein [Actinophytocola sp.]|uniref:xanthine dehydrogenase family protein molybdopterin-binding subunit n=1 Tax=Actinophytocola sp. TaxID=1872138 RepID=UPI002DDD7EA1|nr:molybdopterin cofactor-binding domain-containing protein [Actinophytocola sp.]HEV2778036.1 molybdopterin cofactor-binding domain-containing protein [Actinophytocola sp.]